MTENKPVPLVNPAISEDIALSPAVAAIVNNTTIEAAKTIDLEDKYTNLLRYYALKAKGIFTETNPQDLSDTVIGMQALRKAANDVATEPKKKAA